MDFANYIESKQGTHPVVLSCPHGGFLKPRHIEDKTGGFNIPDRGSFLISKHILNVLSKENISIHYLLSKIHRCKIDFNRPPRGSEAFNQDHPSKDLANQIHDLYHRRLMDLVESCILEYGKCLFIDFHGFTKPHDDYPDIIIGNLFGNTLDIYTEEEDEEDNQIDEEYYWGYSELINELKQHFHLDDGLAITQYNIAYSGGYIIYQFYQKAYVNAIQLEISDKIREDLSLLREFISDITSAIKNCLLE
ncbi:MAG: hypothetical protein BAJALOKI1v1_90003 [Promethearchaeota archaeon]|nr:MAG: hypothetical protein BAJALOKI1v1_90003 [Candidatus Lokiarchaeota archaeon]